MCIRDRFGSTSPEAIALMRQSLRELYGLEGGLLHQYLVFWKRMVQGDFGPSLSAFPTPVSVLIWRALPWTAGLLCFATLLAWCLGNLLGGLAGYTATTACCAWRASLPWASTRSRTTSSPSSC